MLNLLIALIILINYINMMLMILQYLEFILIYFYNRLFNNNFIKIIKYEIKYYYQILIIFKT